MTTSTASNQFGVLRTTSRHKIAGNTAETTGKVGPHSILGIDVENRLVNWLQTCARKGFPIDKRMFIVVIVHITNPFKNDLPGNKWSKNS